MSERKSVLIDIGDLSAPIGSLDWTIAVHFEAKAALNDNTSSRELVERWVGALRQDNRFRTLTDSKGRHYLLWSAFCKDRQPWGLGYSEQAIDAILAEAPPKLPPDLVLINKRWNRLPEMVKANIVAMVKEAAAP